ncbi:unnamed protein product [Lupinus luteus]|uniref:Uncharacterized protein n=1 Tax=Lupinus luteus TaxID=3873 RepID=A0AAV1WA46_LUPLU
MEFRGSNLILLLTQYLTVLCVSRDFDFFYLVQQWPGSYCDTNNGGCYPSTGKFAAKFLAFMVSNLTRKLHSDWPALACPSKDGINFWTHEWDKHSIRPKIYPKHTQPIPPILSI